MLVISVQYSIFTSSDNSQLMKRLKRNTNIFCWTKDFVCVFVLKDKIHQDVQGNKNVWCGLL